MTTSRSKKLNPEVEWEFQGEPLTGPMRTYQVVGKEEVFEIVVPEAWKVTFGPVSVGGGRVNGEGAGSMALRFYEDDKRQRAIFTGVRSFRDLSIPIRRVSGPSPNTIEIAQHKPGMMIETLRSTEEDDDDVPFAPVKSF